MKKLREYYPLFLILSFICLSVGALASRAGDFSWMNLMTLFMAGFFIVFSFFKLLDLKGFAQTYSNYDLVAEQFPVYGYVYPFIEMALGFSYLTAFQPRLTNIITCVVMFISMLGVLRGVFGNSKYKCACLGTVINLPLSYVTLFEDALMFFMALFMITAF